MLADLLGRATHCRHSKRLVLVLPALVLTGMGLQIIPKLTYLASTAYEYCTGTAALQLHQSGHRNLILRSPAPSSRRSAWKR